MAMQVFVSVDGRQQGPMEVSRVNAMLASGALPPFSTLAWHEGLPGWVSLAEVTGVVLPGAHAAPAPEPVVRADGPPSGSSSSWGEVLRTVIPYKNPLALAAYYLGVFGLVPVVGAVLAVPAVVLGFLGLARCRRDVALKGKDHAWAGIVLGATSILGHGLAAIFLA